MNRPIPDSIAATLGFSDLEFKIYCHLLRTGGGTGYGIAKSIGRAGANVYQALGTLQQKGALLTADAGVKTYRALPPEELIAAMEQANRRRLGEARAALRDLEIVRPDDSLYQLTSVAQAYERAAGMIERARSILLFDLFPGPFSRLRKVLDDAVARGVVVAGIIYEAVPADAADWAFPAIDGLGVDALWPGHGMILASDARECLVSLVSRDGDRLLRGVWSDSPYLACVQHSGLGTEIRLHLLLRDHADPMPQISLLGSGAPGLRDLARAQPASNA